MDHNYEVSVIFMVTAGSEEEAWQQVHDQLTNQNVSGWSVPEEAATYVGDDSADG